MKKNPGSKVPNPETKSEAGEETRQESAAGPLAVRWFLSKTVRHGVAMRKHVHRMLCAQRDILAPQAVEAVTTALEEFSNALRAGSTKASLFQQMENLETVANKWLKPYPNAAWRENVEVLLVALAVAMGIRTFFLQPFKIPTGSMQPTLFGVTSENLMNQPDFKIPTGLTRLREWFAGVSYVDVKARTDGSLEEIGAPHGIKIWNIWQTLKIGGKSHTIWFPPDFGQQELKSRAALQLDQPYQKGEQV